MGAQAQGSSIQLQRTRSNQLRTRVMSSFTTVVNNYWPASNPPGLAHNGDYGEWVQTISTRIQNCGSCSNSPVNMWDVTFDFGVDGCTQACSDPGSDKCDSHFCKALAAVTGLQRRRLSTLDEVDDESDRRLQTCSDTTCADLKIFDPPVAGQNCPNECRAVDACNNESWAVQTCGTSPYNAMKITKGDTTVTWQNTNLSVAEPFANLQKVYFPAADGKSMTDYGAWPHVVKQRLVTCSTTDSCTHPPIQMYFRKGSANPGPNGEAQSCNDFCYTHPETGGAPNDLVCNQPYLAVGKKLWEEAGGFCRALTEGWQWLESNLNVLQGAVTDEALSNWHSAVSGVLANTLL